MRGEYVITDSEGNEQVIPNTLVQEGQNALWANLFNRDAVVGWSFEFGAFAEVPPYATLFTAQYTSEPTIGVNGYARTTEAATGWTIVSINDEAYAESPAQVFTAGGGSFDKAFDRFFAIVVTEQPAATFTRSLVSYSSALASAITLLNGQSYTLRYRMYFR